MRICSWTTKNHSARCQIDDPITKDRYVPGTRVNKGRYSDELVMTLIRRALDGEQIKRVAIELGVNYQVALRWCSGEAKYPLLAKVLKERGQ